MKLIIVPLTILLLSFDFVASDSLSAAAGVRLRGTNHNIVNASSRRQETTDNNNNNHPSSGQRMLEEECNSICECTCGVIGLGTQLDTVGQLSCAVHLFQDSIKVACDQCTFVSQAFRNDQCEGF